MNGSPLLKLYPKSWRARYEPEFRAMLTDHPISAMEMFDIVLGAVDAHLRPQPRDEGDGQHRPQPAPPSDRVASTPPGAGWQALFFAHVSLFIVVTSVLAIINELTTPDTWWSLYPLWGWGMVLATHTALTFSWKGLLGAHIAFFTTLNIGLIGINVAYGGPPWSLWPLMTLGILVVSHALMVFRRINLFQAHLFASVFAVLELMLVWAITGFDDILIVLFIAGQLGVLLLAHWLVRVRGWNLFRAHVALYAGTLVLMLFNNIAQEPDDLWVQYPFAMWSVVLVAHALAHFRLARWSGSSWEAMMLNQLGSWAGADRQRALQRTLGAHVYLFLTGVAGFALVNVLGDSGQFWAVWPIGVWYVLLAIHTGYVVMPRHLLGAQLFGWVAGSAGLILIDLFTEGGPWWYWPVMWTGVVLTAETGAVLMGGRRLWGAHLFGGVALTLALIVTDLVTGPPLWWFYPAVGILVTYLIHIGLTLDLDRAMKVASNDR